jgi:hypothetical protein
MISNRLFPGKNIIIYTVLYDPEQIFTISGSGGSEEADMIVDNSKVIFMIPNS